jgi:hypothetical protein
MVMPALITMARVSKAAANLTNVDSVELRDRSQRFAIGEQPICSLAPPADFDYAFAVLICERSDCVFHANGSISHYLRVLSCREFCRFSFLKCVGIVAHLIRSLPGPLGTKRGDARSLFETHAKMIAPAIRASASGIQL